MLFCQQARGAVEVLCMRQRLAPRRQGDLEAGDTEGRHGVQQIAQREFAFARRKPAGARLPDQCVAPNGGAQRAVAKSSELTAALRASIRTSP